MGTWPKQHSLKRDLDQKIQGCVWGGKMLTAKKKTNPLAANPKHKTPKENQTGSVQWTEFRARKQLPMPSRDLSNFSPGGRTGYTEELREKSRAGRWICCRFAWKTRCSSKPCAPQSLENSQHSGVFISTYQQERLNANLLFCLFTATFRPVASQLMPSSNRFFKAKGLGLPTIDSSLPQSVSFLPAPDKTSKKTSPGDCASKR